MASLRRRPDHCGYGRFWHLRALPQSIAIMAEIEGAADTGRRSQEPVSEAAFDRCCRKSRPREPWGIGWRFDLASVGLIGVSGIALAGAASTLMPPIDARNSRAGVLWWRPDEAQG